LIRVCSWAISLPNSQGYQREFTDHTRAGGDQPPAFKQRITEATAILVLSRKVNEVLVINYGDIQFKVCVTEIRGDKVKIGVEAPLEVRVDRLEVWEAKQKAGIKA
jgi:carbon storage regulator